jgi:threonine aldolase
MLECVLTARTGDDVFGEDPTVLALEEYAADLFGKEKALFVPTGTMSNLVAIFSHCRGRASEMIIGSQSHINLWEGGGAANLGGVSSRQIQENHDGTLDLDAIRDHYCLDNDDHFAKTELICLENSHNMMGGTALEQSYIDDVCELANELDVKVHIDGARIFNASISVGIPVKDLCHGVDSVSVCLSKGLGSPLGSVLVGEKEFIRLAKRARKRCGGGMRQVGVVASMGMFAIQNNVERLAEDHFRAKRMAKTLYEAGFKQPQGGDVDTNIVYFGLPDNSKVTKEEVCDRLSEHHGVLVGSGYNKGGELFRICTHMDINDKDVDKALESILHVCLS